MSVWGALKERDEKKFLNSQQGSLNEMSKVVLPNFRLMTMFSVPWKFEQI